MTTTDKDMGRLHILQQMRLARGAFVLTGWPERKGGAKPHTPGEPLTMAELASVHEFGTKKGTVPKIDARPMLRYIFDKNKEKYRESLREVVKAVIEEGGTFKGGLTLFGEEVVGDTKKWITDLKEPDIKQATKDAKGSSNPLIDTAAMRDAVDKQVVMGR